MWELDNMINLERFMKIDPKSLELDPFYLTSPQVTLDESKVKYYEHYFKNQQVTNIVESFYEILFWTMDYYFNSCKCWITHYRYNHAPFITDIYNNLDMINKFNFKVNNPISVEQQLISVIPPYYKHILSNKLQQYYQDLNLRFMLPNRFKLDCHYKDMFWAVNPELPYLDIDIIKNNI